MPPDDATPRSDEPRDDSRSFVEQLAPRQGVTRVMLVSGDRAEEARYLAERVGITEIHGGQSPEDKVRIATDETAKAPTLFVGDGINDAPAIAAAGFLTPVAGAVAQEAIDVFAILNALRAARSPARLHDYDR